MTTDGNYLPFDGNAKWIWHNAKNGCDCDSIAETAVFRRNFIVKNKTAELTVHVSADADYILYCNGNYIGRGPARGNIENHFYDTYELSNLLHTGDNSLAVIVVGFAGSWPNFCMGGAPASRITATNAFILDGILREPDSEPQLLHTSNSWKVKIFPSLKFQANSEVPSAGPGEVFCDDLQFRNWMETDFVDTEWEYALELTSGYRPNNVRNSPLPYRLIPREIPFLDESARQFQNIYGADEMPLKIPAGTVMNFTFDAEVETTGFPVISLQGGACKIHLFYSEHLLQAKQQEGYWQLSHEQVSGPLFDIVEFKGGTLNWQPFFWRAFRYMRIQIQTTNESVELIVGKYIFTSYPYQMRSEFTSDNDVYNRYWEVGLRTLQLCSHDIFEDCPYYERLQYIADTQIASLTAFAVSGDTALTAQAIKHFRWSLNHEGITAGNYPSRSPVILPIWSLHLINVIYDYYIFTGDKTVIKENMWTMLQVISWFRNKIGADGLVEKLPYWNVADWSPQWDWDGQPPDINTGISALPNLFLCACLRKIADMAREIFEFDIQTQLMAEYKSLSEVCVNTFWDSKTGLFADTPNKNSYSQLINAWAILSDVADSQMAAEISANLYKHKTISMPSVFGKFFVFQALLKNNNNEQACELLEEWERFLQQGLTTWPEGTVIPRSECHIWAALPTFGLQRLILGFRILEPGGTSVELKPYLERNNSFYGKIPLMRGEIELKYSHEKIAIKAPPEVTVKLILPSGRHLIKNNYDWISIPVNSSTIEKEVCKCL